jgi:hypothetical protein
MSFPQLRQIQVLTTDSQQSLDYAITEISIAIRKVSALREIVKNLASAPYMEGLCKAICEQLQSMEDEQLIPARAYIHGVRAYKAFPDEESQPKPRGVWATDPSGNVVATGGHEG